MVMGNGFSSPRSEAFPAGLRVLVVDDDPTWLKILEKMLKRCSYEVTTCGLAREALKLLRDRKDVFDIVISDVNMPDMDGFKLLEHVGLEMDLPVIMMSVDGETSRVMKGVQHGACDYLLKPIRMKELKNIWQHVLRKRMHEVRDIVCVEDRNGSDPSNDGHYGGNQTLLGKRKDFENKHDEKESTDPSSSKKARVVWTVELHQKFVKAVNQIGIDSDKVGPKKILDLMNVPWLTRENVASHLQKYRLYLSRIRKEDRMESSFGGMKNSDHCSLDSSGILTLPSSTFGQQNDVSSNHVYPGNSMPIRDIDTKPLDIDLKSSNLLPLTEHRKHFNSEKSDPHKANSTSQVGLGHSFGPRETNINCLWTAEIPSVQFEPELKPHPNLDGCFKADLLESAPHINPGSSISGSDNIALIDIPPLNVMERTLESFSESHPETFRSVFDMPLDMKNQSTSINKQALLERAIQSFPLHSKSHLSNQQGLEPNIDVALHTDYPSSNQDSIGNESVFGLLGEDLMFRWFHGGESLSKDVGFDYKGLSDFNFPEHVSEVPLPKFGLDYDLFDQGFGIA